MYALLKLSNSLKMIRIDRNISDLWQIVCKKYNFKTNISVFISVFNQLDAQNLFHSKCSKHEEAWNKTYCETNFVHQVG